MRLVGGRAALLAGLRELASSADRDLEPLLERVGNREELATATAEVLLAGSDREARRVLGLAMRIEYAHPAMTSAIAGGGQLRPAPGCSP